MSWWIHFLVQESQFLVLTFILETGSDLTDSDNCPPSPLLDWSFLMSCVWVCVCVFSTRDKNHTARHGQTPRCQPVSYTLSGCVSRWVLSFLTRRESSRGRRDGWREAGPPLVLWRGKMSLAGPGWLPLWDCGCFSLLLFFLCWFLSPSDSLYSLSLSYGSDSLCSPPICSSGSTFCLQELEVQCNTKLLNLVLVQLYIWRVSADLKQQIYFSLEWISGGGGGGGLVLFT